jgi:hypothetical protein
VLCCAVLRFPSTGAAPEQKEVPAGQQIPTIAGPPGPQGPAGPPGYGLQG